MTHEKKDIIMAVNFVFMNLDKMKELAIKDVSSVGEVYYKIKYEDGTINTILKTK